MFFDRLAAPRLARRGSSRDPDLPHPSGRRPDASRATPESQSRTGRHARKRH